MRGVESITMLAPSGPMRGGGANFTLIFFKQKGILVPRATCPCNKPTRPWHKGMVALVHVLLF